MNNSLALADSKKLFETILPIEFLDLEDIKTARGVFDSYKQKGIIIDSEFDSERWQFCDEYSRIGLVFKIPVVTYKKYYETIFGFGLAIFQDYFKTYIILTLGKNVLVTLQRITNDVKKLLKYDYHDILDIDEKFASPYHLTEFIELLPCVNNEKHDELIQFIDNYVELNMNDYLDRKRSLAEFESYFKFNDLLSDYWNLSLAKKERLFYYPIYLWWKITAIIPLRPREFILTPRDCLSTIDDKHYLSLRRNRLKGSNNPVHYNIEQDYIRVKYQIPDILANSIHDYIKLSDKFEDNDTNTLFRTDLHYVMFGHKKHTNSRLYTYANLNCCLRMFFQNILEKIMGMNVIKGSEDTSINLGLKDIEYIYLGDTRHIAMINIIAEGGTPTIAMQLAGHADITISSHYFSNITNLIECRTYAKFKSMIGSNEDFVIGSNYYTPNTVVAFSEIENGARCYSENFMNGNMNDCRNSSGENGEIGYCYNCPFYRKNGMGYFIVDENIYKNKIENDCTYLKLIINKVRKGVGYTEEIKESLLRLQNSSFNYEKYYLQKMIYNRRTEDNTDVAE